MSADALEALLLRAMAGALRGMKWRASLGVGAGLGDALRVAGLRRRVAEDNLARVVPAWPPAERQRILRAHYRELGRIAAEYARLPDLVRAPAGEVVAEVRGGEHLEAVKRGGRGAILMTGHFGNFELLGAVLGARHPLDFVVKPLNNAESERWLQRQRERAGVGTLRSDLHVRRIYEALRANRWVAMLADQDARRAGVFVPFLGRPASTAVGPARVALATGAPIVMGFAVRLADGRHVLEIDAPYTAEGCGEEAVLRVTAWHTARLEEWVRRHPYNWFWLHRRWKTAPSATAGD